MTDVDSDRPDLSGRAGSAALRKLYDAHARDLHRYLARRLDPVVAEDLMAETFLVAWCWPPVCCSCRPRGPTAPSRPRVPRRRSTPRRETKSCTDGGDWSHYPSAEFLASLPRDPHQLYDQVRHMPMPVAISETEWVLIRVATTLATGRAPAELRAALYRALALLPGLEVTEQVANLDGHQGTALGVTEYGVRHDLIIDPNTGQFIGERMVIESGNPDLPPDTIFSYTSVSNPVIVDEVGETR